MIRWETGRRVRDARRAQGITQSRLADTLGVSPNLVGRWERGDDAPSPAALDALIDALDIEADEAERWIASVVPTEVELVTEPWLQVPADEVARVPKITPATPPPAQIAAPPSPPMPSLPLAPSPPAPRVPAAPAADPFLTAPGSSFGLDREALTRSTKEDDRFSITDFLRAGALSEAFDNLLRKDQPKSAPRQDEPKPPSSRPITPPVRPANGNPMILNGNGPLPIPPAMVVNGAPPPLAVPPPNGTATMPTLSVVKPEPTRVRASAVAVEQERKHTIARKKAAEDRALRRFVRKHGVTPAVYEQLKTSVNVGSAFPVPATANNPGSVRYSESPLDETRIKPWVYLARRIATIAVLGVLALVFFWALAELAKGWQAFLDLWGGAEEDSGTTDALGTLVLPVGLTMRSAVSRMFGDSSRG